MDEIVEIDALLRLVEEAWKVRALSAEEECESLQEQLEILVLQNAEQAKTIQVMRKRLEENKKYPASTRYDWNTWPADGLKGEWTFKGIGSGS